jgi:4-hydroxy-2-oxoheptanedioate aldolase
VPYNDLQNAKRALDAGAFGIIFPMCNSVAEAEQAVQVCKYPPLGCRSVGGGLHALNFDCSPAEYYARANDEILVIIQAEHVDCVDDCERIFRVPGIDAMFVGPNDLLSSMHKTPAMETGDPEFVAALHHLKKTADACGIASGIHTADADAASRRIDEGWRFIAIASELAFMNQSARAAASRFGSGHVSTTGAARY